MPSRLCPHCNIQSNFDARVVSSGYWGRDDEKQPASLQIYQCQHCGGLIAALQNTENPPTEIRVYPAAIPSVHESVPSKVKSDYMEGVECMGIGAYKAAATMFRRALQQVMIDKKAPSGKRLVDQIEALAKTGILPKELAEWSHEIRLWGNEGAHPSADGLDEVGAEDVEQVREFLDRVFEYGYIMPWKLARSRAKRSNKKEQAER